MSTNHSKVSIVYEVDATTMLIGQNVNFRYCKEMATFERNDAVEFMFFTGWQGQLEISNVLGAMRSFGCTEEFIKALKMAIDSGARWALFYTV